MHETTSPVPARTPLRAALLISSLFAVLTFLIHLITTLWGNHLGYGFHGDELYFLVCGHHLAWGYVDQPPLVALQARLAEMLFGVSPAGVRIFSFLAAGVNVGLAGLLAWQLRGRSTAQLLAMTAVLAAPVYLATSNYLSMNSFEPCFWMGSLFVILRLADGSAGPRAWLVFGLLAGLGIENKHSTVFFLIALLAGLLLSPQRRLLRSRWCAAGVALLILIASPNFIWQWIHHFPTYEMLSNVAHSDQNIKLPPLAFLAAQVNILFVVAAPLWIGGLFWLAFARKARPWRSVALTYMVFLPMMMLLHAKHYYLAPIYPVFFAAGAVALGGLTRRSWPAIGYTTLLACCFCLVTAPLVLTILPPEKYNQYRADTSLFLAKTEAEKWTSPLPSFLSGLFGYPQMVEGFAARYNALPPDVRAHTAIFCSNYAEASAVNILGPKYGLPTAISGHQTYFYWGWNGYTGESVLTLGDHREDYTDNYAEVIDLGPFDVPWTQDHEHRRYFWLRHRKRTYAADWPEFKNWN
jgi:hypothetical protein